MSKITCEICMDLIPLVRDGVASEDSRKAVEEHVETCECCRSFYNIEEMPAAADKEKIVARMKRKMQFFFTVLMMFGIFFGLGLTAGDDMFYNSLIMPVIGALGYIIFRKKVFYNVPVLLLITHLLTNALAFLRGKEHLDVYSILMWTCIYSILAVVGALIAWLLHFALRREE